MGGGGGCPESPTLHSLLSLRPRSQKNVRILCSGRVFTIRQSGVEGVLGAVHPPHMTRGRPWLQGWRRPGGWRGGRGKARVEREARSRSPDERCSLAHARPLSLSLRPAHTDTPRTLTMLRPTGLTSRSRPTMSPQPLLQLPGVSVALATRLTTTATATGAGPGPRGTSPSRGGPSTSRRRGLFHVAVRVSIPLPPPHTWGRCLGDLSRRGWGPHGAPVWGPATIFPSFSRHPTRSPAPTTTHTLKPYTTGRRRPDLPAAFHRGGHRPRQEGG